MITFIAMLIIKAVIAFVVFPRLTHTLGANYHSDLFPDDYDLIANNLIHGHGYRVYADTSETMLRSPGFVLVLAAIFALFGKSLLAVQVVQYFMSAAVAAMVYLIARRLSSVRRVALVAAGIFLFNPVSMMSDTRGGEDTTLTFCLTLALWLLLRALDSKRPRDFALTGLALGYTMLVKASVALIFPAIFLFLAWPCTTRVRLILLRNFAIIGVLAALVMAPWVVRNYEISGKFEPTMTIAGLALFQGEEAERIGAPGEDSWQRLDDASQEQLAIGHQMGLRMREDFFPQFYTIGDEIAFYHELAHRAWAAYRADPVLFARVVIHNIWAFWFQGRTAKATLLNVIGMLPFLAVSILGAAIAVRRERRHWILVIAVLAYILPHLVIIAVARYSTAVMPLMSVLAAGVLFAPARRPLFTRLSFAANIRNPAQQTERLGSAWQDGR